MVIESPNEDDTGKYECLASNKVGEVKEFATLKLSHIDSGESVDVEDTELIEEEDNDLPETNDSKNELNPFTH